MFCFLLIPAFFPEKKSQLVDIAKHLLAASSLVHETMQLKHRDWDDQGVAEALINPRTKPGPAMYIRTSWVCVGIGAQDLY